MKHAVISQVVLGQVGLGIDFRSLLPALLVYGLLPAAVVFILVVIVRLRHKKR